MWYGDGFAEAIGWSALALLVFDRVRDALRGRRVRDALPARRARLPPLPLHFGARAGGDAAPPVHPARAHVVRCDRCRELVPLVSVLLDSELSPMVHRCEAKP
jgi:hypothetical protein